MEIQRRCIGTPTMPKPQYTQIILSHKYKVLSQNTKVWNSIRSLGLHLIQIEIFSSLHNPQQAPSFCHTTGSHFAARATPLLNNNLHIYIYIRAKQYLSVGKQARKPCNKEVNNFGKDHEANLTHLM